MTPSVLCSFALHFIYCLALFGVAHDPVILEFETSHEPIFQIDQYIYEFVMLVCLCIINTFHVNITVFLLPSFVIGSNYRGRLMQNVGK